MPAPAPAYDAKDLMDRYNASIGKTYVHGDPEKIEKLSNEELDYMLGHFYSQLDPHFKNAKEYPAFLPPNDPAWLAHPDTVSFDPDKARKLADHPVLGRQMLTDDTNPTLIAFGLINGGTPPTTTGKIINFGSLARTGAGIYTIVLGFNGCPAGNSICFTQITSVVADTNPIEVTDTTDTTKTFTCQAAGAAVDTLNFKFAFYRMPYTS